MLRWDSGDVQTTGRSSALSRMRVRDGLVRMQDRVDGGCWGIKAERERCEIQVPW